MALPLRGQVTNCAMSVAISSTKMDKFSAHLSRPSTSLHGMRTTFSFNHCQLEHGNLQFTYLRWVRDKAHRQLQPRKSGSRKVRGQVADEDSGSYAQSEEAGNSKFTEELFSPSTLPMVWSTQPNLFGASADSPSGALQPLSKESAMGIVYGAATGSSTGWTTGSGLAGPTEGAGHVKNVWPPLVSKSVRRSKAVEFTCNKCGGRTQRAINPHAYNTGTVFVQCGQCQVYHKLVDHLKLFHELKGPIYGSAYATPDMEYHKSFDPYDHKGSQGSSSV